MGDLEGWNAPGDLSRMRISDADRHRVLRQAAGEGRLEFDELDERPSRAKSSKSPPTRSQQEGVWLGRRRWLPNARSITGAPLTA